MCCAAAGIFERAYNREASQLWLHGLVEWSRWTFTSHVDQVKPPTPVHMNHGHPQPASAGYSMVEDLHSEALGQQWMHF